MKLYRLERVLMMDIKNKFESMSNKKFAYECIKLLKEYDKLDDSIISILIDEEKCHNLFNCSGKFTIFKEIPKDCSDELLAKYCYDINGRQRYYKDKIIIDEREFVITNHWYGPNKSMPDNRTLFLEWIMTIINNIK